MALAALDCAVEETRARLTADGGLLATVGLALIGAPAMVMQVTLGSVETVGRLFAGQTISIPQPTVGQVLALLALVLAQMLGQLTVARLVASPDETVRESLRLAGHRLPAFLGASLIVGLLGMLLLTLAGLILGVLSALGGPGKMLAVLLILLLAVGVVVVWARLQLLIPQTITSREGPVTLLRSTARRSRGMTGSLVVLLVVLLLLSLVVPGAAQLLLGIPAAFVGGPAAGLVAGAIGSGLVGSLVTVLALSLAVALHARSGLRSGADEGDLRRG